MSTPLRIATFNVENLDETTSPPTLDDRIDVLRPQLERLRADVLCLQEVHGQESGGERTLSALDRLLAGTVYETFEIASTRTTRGEPYDERNLVVVSRFPVDDTSQLKHDEVEGPTYRMVMSTHDEQAKAISWERPIFHAELDLGAGQILHVINLHLKSMIPTDVPGQKVDRYSWRSAAAWAEGYFVSSMKRVGQALETRVLVDRLFDAAEDDGVEPLIVVCGDLNAESDSVPVNAIRGPIEEVGNPELVGRVLVPCEFTVPQPARYTLLHLGQGVMLDHILVSRALLAHYRGCEIHNEILPDESGAYRTDKKFPESDHAPVVAEFVLP